MDNLEQNDLKKAITDLKEALKNSKSQNALLRSGTAKMSDADIAELLELLETEREIFDQYNPNITTEQRKHYRSTGVKSSGFINAAFQSSQQYSMLMPPVLTAAQYANDIDEFNRLKQLYMVAKDLSEDIYDAYLIAGDIAYKDSLQYYNVVRETAKTGNTHAVSQYDYMKTFFAKTKSSSSGSEPTQEQIERDVHSMLKGTKEGQIVIRNEIPVQAKSKLTVMDNAHSPHESIDRTVEDKIIEK